MFTVPEQFVRETIERHGDGGRAWLDRLPDILAACAAQWDLTLGPPFGNLSWHYVAPARRADGSDVVVKACSPTAGECLLETAALRFFDGHGAVRLIESDGEREVMVLERLEPGTLLSTVEDDAEATAIAAGVMEQLWRPLPPDHPFPSVAGCGSISAAPADLSRRRWSRKPKRSSPIWRPRQARRFCSTAIFIMRISFSMPARGAGWRSIPRVWPENRRMTRAPCCATSSPNSVTGRR